MLKITIDDHQVRKALQRVQRHLDDLTPVMRAVAMELEARVSQRFETERDPTGRPWRALSPRTVARKKGRGRILYDSGDLLGSLTSRAGRDFAEVGFGQPYAAYHEYGTRKMPRRGLLMADPAAQTLSDADRDAVLETISEALARALAKP